MDGFFEKYGRVIIVAVAICFVLLFLTPMRNVVGSSINGFARNFANKVGDSLGTVKMPDGSDSIKKEKSSMIIGTVMTKGKYLYGTQFYEYDTQFANAIPEQATAIVFTDEVAPEGAVTTDLTVAKDGDVVGWLDGNTWKVSTQDPNKAVTFNENCVKMFYVLGEHYDNKLSRLTHISFDNVDTSNVMNMNMMFRDCTSLTNLDISSFDTSKVTDMRNMFKSCSNLTTLDLSNFDTSKVTDMEYMFYECSKLTTLDVSHFDTSNVTNMHDIFFDCKSLTSLNLSNFDTNNVTDMRYMFDGCNSLTEKGIKVTKETYNKILELANKDNKSFKYYIDKSEAYFDIIN